MYYMTVLHLFKTEPALGQYENRRLRQIPLSTMFNRAHPPRIAYSWSLHLYPHFIIEVKNIHLLLCLPYQIVVLIAMVNRKFF